MARAAWKIASLSSRAAVMGGSAGGPSGPPREQCEKCRQTRNGIGARSAPVFGMAVDRDAEPAPGVGPVLLGRGQRDAQGGGGLFGGEPGKEPEFDERGLAGVVRFELPEGVVQGEQPVV